MRDFCEHPQSQFVSDLICIGSFDFGIIAARKFFSFSLSAFAVALTVGRHEIVHLLGYDTSANPHNYSIYWDNSKIVWYVDGNIIRQVTNDNVNPFPSKSQYVYQSVWDASYVCGGAWAGVNTWANAPHYARWTNIAVHCPGQ